jgi:thiol:disulfide interchange protein DsbD
MSLTSRAARVLIFLLLPLFSVAQDKLPFELRVAQQRVDDSTVAIQFHVGIRPGIRLYQLQEQESDALYSTISFDSTATRILRGRLSSLIKPQAEADKALGANLQYFTDSVTWQQSIHVPAGDSTTVKGSVQYMYRDGDAFLNGEESFAVYVRRGNSTQAVQSPESVSSSEGQGGIQTRSLWWIFLAAFGGGLLALLTPCVYSMIPVTVSFFTKRSTNRQEGIRNALWYAASIVVIFTLLGFLITLVFGPAALNNLATNWIANLVFFALFLVFGISFLGAFDINLPASWMNRTDARAGTRSFMGIFFMALTLVLVSFSCTGPIIGNLLVLAAKGSYMGPLVGMLGFSVALALPFALFAFFPSKLNILGKAGGWLNAVKVTLGFLELALALKFLSNADLVKGWRLLDREVFIVLWVIIFALLGIYLLGKLRFHHDDELPKNDFGLPYVSVPRLFFAIASLSFALYLVPGLWGAPLKAVGAFLPPPGTQDFVLGRDGTGTRTVSEEQGKSGLPHPQKYYDQMRIYEPEVVVKYGMTTYFDYAEALAIARAQKKPLMIDFTGINCVNCRKMEAEVWSDPEVMRRLKDNFVIVSLYVDVQDVDIPENEQYVSEALGMKITTLGNRNADMQVTRFQANSQPYYFFLDGQENRLIPEGYGYDPDIQKFIRLLDTAVERYNSSGKN